MSGRTRFLIGAACCAYPAMSHLGVVTGELRWAVVGLALLAWGLFAARMRGSVAALVGLLTLGLGLGVSALLPAAVLYAPPLGLYVTLGALFALTLRRGDEPMVSRFARIERGGELPPDLARYTRTLTGLWSAFFALMAAVSFSLALSAPLETWSLFTNLVSYVLVGLFFVGEYLFRRARFRHHPHVGFVEFLSRLPTYRVWARSRRGRLADGP
jgi:uncharacterized membrane protein